MLNSRDITLVVSEYAPPQIGGTSSVLYELIRHFPRESVVLATRRRSPDEATDNRELHVPTIYIGAPRSHLHRSWTKPIRIVRMAIDVVRQLKHLQKRPRNIFAVFPSLDFLLVSVTLSRLLDVPLYTYLNDCLEGVAITRYDKLLSKLAARFVFRHGIKAYAMSALMERYYSEKGLGVEALPHGIDASLARHPDLRHETTRIRIGFAGEVYQTNDYAIADLTKVKQLLPARVELHFALGHRSAECLARLGVVDSIDSISNYSTYGELLDFLSTCDILFVPMNFESVFSEDLKTIFPTKVTDYWLAQRPILVYGPKEYAFVTKAVQDGYAVSVTEKGVEGIASAITRIMDAPELRQELVLASRRMIEQHNGARISRKLMADLEIDHS